MLDTGVIAQAIMYFVYEVWDDPRFASYRPTADQFLAQLEPIVYSYDYEWVDDPPVCGCPGFYIYASCGGLCSTGSLLMYNQGATMAKALLLIDRVKRLKNETPDPALLHKADASAAYFLQFVRLSGEAYDWDYGGCLEGGMEDIDHAHLDLSLVIWAKKFDLGGLTTTDMTRLAGTMHKVLSSDADPNDTSATVDGLGVPQSNWDRVPVGFDWIDLTEYDPTLLDGTIQIYNTHLTDETGSRFFLGWAEILRWINCVQL
jgi:hypothetical protein